MAELFSWVLLPSCSPPGCPFPIKSLALSAHVSPQTIHFRVLDKSSVSGPGRGPPSWNIYALKTEAKVWEDMSWRDYHSDPIQAATWSWKTHEMTSSLEPLDVEHSPAQPVLLAKFYFELQLYQYQLWCTCIFCPMPPSNSPTPAGYSTIQLNSNTTEDSISFQKLRAQFYKSVPRPPTVLLTDWLQSVTDSWSFQQSPPWVQWTC